MRRTATTLRALARNLATSAPRPAAYAPPLKAGVLPAFDEAVKFIAADKAAKLKQLEELKNTDTPVEVLEKLEVEAEANDPETRWRAKNGQGTSPRWLGKGGRKSSWR